MRKEERVILQVVDGEYPERCTLSGIRRDAAERGVSMGKNTVHRFVNRLLQVSLLSRPDGLRGGITITEDGRRRA